jgi:glycosyltransferase involved in cell wall biosynthesis
LLIFVIAYQAESTLVQVLERIPRSVFRDWDCEILVVDDASRDRTFDIGREYQEAHPDLPLTVLRNTYNQGYGGNQKVGYAYAIAEKFDVVAMVHGDGQYAPEELPRLLEPLRKDQADAVSWAPSSPSSTPATGSIGCRCWSGSRWSSTPTTSTSTPRSSSSS